MIPKFRVWLPDIDQMLRVKALVFEKDKTRCVCGYSFDFYLEDENATIPQVLGGCLGMILTLLISLWLAGVVIQYGWNNIIAATFEIQRITFWQAVGIDLLITAITGNPKGDTEKSWLEILGKVIYWYLVLWALMWIVVSLL